jgi:hypothetical protein
LVRCWAGCDITEIVGAIGWRLSDLFDAPRQRTVGGWSGPRLPPRTRKRPPTNGSGAATTSPPVEYDFYNDLATVICRDEWVVITDSWKVVAELNDDFVILTTYGGDWREYREEVGHLLTGARVMIAVDDDVEAAEIATSLTSYAAEIEVA